jgi:ADP-heptose:LPS heptosyltransferase
MARAPVDPRLWRRVLVVRPDNIGDVLLLAPALRALVRAVPDVELTVLTSPAGADGARLLPWVDDVIVHRAAWQDLPGHGADDPAAALALVAELAARHFDAAFVSTSWSQGPDAPAFVCYLAGIPVRVAHAGPFSGRTATHRAAPLPDACHQADRTLALLAAVGIPDDGVALDAVVPPDADAEAGALLAGAGVAEGAPFVLVAPGATVPTRRWPAPRYAALVAALVATGRTVVVVGAPREADDLVAVRAVPGIVDLVGRTRLATLAGLVGRAAVVVANNSGPMHLADALRVPQVVLYGGCERVSQWAPRSGAPAVLLLRDVPCSPCHGFSCPHDLACYDLDVGEVLDHVLTLGGSR